MRQHAHGTGRSEHGRFLSGPALLERLLGVGSERPPVDVSAEPRVRYELEQAVTDLVPLLA